MKLDRIFTSHMVLQREKPILIYGQGEEGEVITVSFAGKKNTAEVKQGQWQTEFSPMGVQRGLDLLAENEKGERIFLEDILVGDVYLAGGQSNMEFHMKYDADYAKEQPGCTNPDIRFFDYPEVSYEGQEEVFDYSRMGFWRTCDPENLAYFSAVAYYFAKEISAREGLPIGLVGCNWGGTPAASWMDEDHLKKHGQVWLDKAQEGLKSMPEDYLENIRKSPVYHRGDPFSDPVGNELLYGISREKQLELMKNNPMPAEPFAGPCDPNWPCSLYRHMLLPLKRQSFCGVLWYQGETDVLEAEVYEGVWGDLIDCWRELFGEQLPFFAVQLAPFQSWLGCEGSLFPVIRQAQETISREKEEVYLASSSDVGDPFDIHPKKKAPIGYRLALLAEKALYQRELLCQAPRLTDAWTEGRELFLSFSDAGEGLQTQPEKELPLVLMVTANGREEELSGWQWRVSGSRVEIHLKEEISGMLDIRLAQTPYYEMNLKNSAKIPAMPGRLCIQTG